MLLLGAFSVSQAQDPTSTPFSQAERPSQVPLYDLFELRFDVVGEFANPYNPAEVSVTAIFNAPDGQTFQIPAFYMQPYDDLTGTAQPVGNPEWRVRFTPTQVGDWRYSVEVVTSARRDLLFSDESFTVTPSDAKGFIQVGANQRYFQFQNGSPYFPIGENLGWSWEEGGGLETYLEWLDQLAANGGNYGRLFVDTAWFIGLDWVRPAGDYTASQGQAWMMDQILEAAQQRGIYLQVVLIWHQAFIQSPGLPVNPPSDVARPNTEIDFDSHAYNQVNGGPMSRPESLFLNPLVKGLLEQKLRYMLARWGYSPQIFAWEVITDVDRLPNYNPTEHLTFINDLATFVRQQDPYPHLMTLGSRGLLPELVTNPLVDFAQVRVFHRRPIEEAPDQVNSVLNTLYNPLLQTAGKPILLTEFSLNPWFEPTADDPTGLHLEQTLWSVALSGAGGSAMSQWWDTYVDAQDLYPDFYALSQFVAEVDWPNMNLRPVQVGLVDSRGDNYQPLRIENFNRNFRGQSPFETVYTLTADGPMPSTSVLSSYLYGSQFNAQASFPQTFIITPPVDTILSIGIRDIAPNGTAALVLTLDNQPYATLNLTEGSANTKLDIPLPAGYHRLVLDNLGEDWIELNYIEIADYIAPLRAVALADSTMGSAFIWLHQRAYTWQNLQTQSDFEAQRFNLTLPQMPEGVYQIEFWDTATGAILGQELGRVQEGDNGVLAVPLLPIQTSLALRITRTEVLENLTDEATPLPTRTPAVQASFMPSATATATATQTLTPSSTATSTPTATASSTATPTASTTPTQTATTIPTDTPTAITPTGEATDSGDSSPINTPSLATGTTEPPAESLTPTDAFIPRFTRTPRPTANAP